MGWSVTCPSHLRFIRLCKIKNHSCVCVCVCGGGCYRCGGGVKVTGICGVGCLCVCEGLILGVCVCMCGV